MAKADLIGKTVMVARGDSDALLSSLKGGLEKQGATVVVAQHFATKPDNVQLIADEIASHQPKIDALLIHHTDTDHRDSQIAAVALAKKFKGGLPVIVHDWNDDVLVTQAIENAGAKYVGFEGSADKVAFAIADAIAQHGKTGRAVGAK